MTDKLNSLDKDFLLTWFRHHMTAEMRGKLMRDLPGQYNRLVEMSVVRVVRRGRPADELNRARPECDLLPRHAA